MAEADFFLKLSGIDGESCAAGHKGEIDISSFTWGLSAPHDRATGQIVGATSFQEVQFTAKASRASPLLATACDTHQTIKTATLTVRKAGGSQEEYYVIELSDAMVVSYHSGGKEESAVIPIDQFSLTFNKISFNYKPQKSTGSLGSTTAFQSNLLDRQQ